MANPNVAYVQYFIPIDGDSEEHPNVFLVKKPLKDVRLSDVQAASSSRRRRLLSNGGPALQVKSSTTHRSSTTAINETCRHSRCRARTSSAPSRPMARRTVRPALAKGRPARPPPRRAPTLSTPHCPPPHFALQCGWTLHPQTSRCPRLAAR